MSKEKVAHFVKAISETNDLNQKVAAADKTPDAWVKLGKQAGFDFSKDDVLGFVQQVTGTTVTDKDAITVLLGHGELSEKQLDAVAGGALDARTASTPIRFSPVLLQRVGSQFGIVTRADGFVQTSGPSWAQSSGGMPGGTVTKVIS
jgi:predicted ribosomally synthesized peptide with nif11-like leader